MDTQPVVVVVVVAEHERESYRLRKMENRANKREREGDRGSTHVLLQLVTHTCYCCYCS